MIGDAVILLRHAVRSWRAGQVRFRLETFGLYYPAAPYASPWWLASARNLVLLLRQGRAYAAWVVEMEHIRRGGAAAWWNRQRSLSSSQDLHDLLRSWNEANEER